MIYIIYIFIYIMLRTVAVSTTSLVIVNIINSVKYNRNLDKFSVEIKYYGESILLKYMTFI